MENYDYLIHDITSDLTRIDIEIQKIISTYETKDIKNLFTLIFKNSKKIRSVVTILFIKAIFNEITDKQIKICALIEILHNASLIHDDIVDNSDYRRDKPSLKKLFGNKTAVLKGDLFLAIALKELAYINNDKIIEKFATAFINMCSGEINQLISQNKNPKIEDYLKKSEQKTAELFKIALVCSLLIENQTDYLDVAKTLGENFGLAFQIRNDIDDIFYKTDIKSCSEDIKNGIYTAPVIYYLQNNPHIKNINIRHVRTNEILQKSNSLCSFYVQKSIDLLTNFSDNHYKQSFIDLCRLLEKGQNYEF